MMSDEDSEKELVYFLDAATLLRQLRCASDDKMVAISHLHEKSAPDAANSEYLLKDLCEYVVLLDGYSELLTTITSAPVVKSEDGTNQYALLPPDAMLFKFYLPLLGVQEQKMRDHRLSFAIN